ncbi:MAG TPA: amino acid transporter [Chloroflexota bacterium]|nr:amino acid transporter [Chloroflexota bacterium]
MGGRFVAWLLKGHTPEPEGFYEREEQIRQQPQHHPQPWYKVMCLTGVDYFSTLGYQPGIAALAAGLLSPLATLILVIVTLFGALPMYRRVAEESPHGDGSISMLERLMGWWKGKLFVLCLIGFVATGFVITITLSAADATAHLAENPFTRFVHGYEVVTTLVLIGLLGAVFLKGFGEAIGVAVVLVVSYILLNLVVIGAGLWQIAQEPRLLADWTSSLFQIYATPLAMVGAAMLVFPRLALGLSGFETGVVVMPLVEGDPNDDPDRPRGRIRNTHKLLTTAALIMSVLLIASALVTTLLIPHAELEEGGPASGRALAYLAHKYLGEAFGTVYDVSTILILWFAGASAMAGLLNIVPRYLPRYGMAPNWARATRPLVLIFTAISFVVTIVFRASVEAQAGAYATGVLALMTSATVAVTLSAWRERQRLALLLFGLVTLIFIYTTIVTVVEQPSGLKIAGLFIVAIVVVSAISRLWRQTELRVGKVTLDVTARRFIREAAKGEIRIIAHDTDRLSLAEYEQKEEETRRCNHVPLEHPILFLEITVPDASEFAPDLHVWGVQVGPYCVLRAQSAAVPNAIAAFLLYIRDLTGKVPHVYFEWSEGSPFHHLARYVLIGEGDIAPVCHEVLRQAEREPARRPTVHVA